MGKYQRYAEYKDSGVEWLGEAPSNWSVLSIARISNKITNGYVGATREIFYEFGVRYLQSLHIKKNRINFHTPYYVSEAWSNEKSKSILKEGDVLIVQTGDIGQVAAVTKEFEGCNCHALIIVSGNERISGFYLSWLLNSDYGCQTLKSIQTGALHPHLNCDAIKDIKILLPDIQTQKNISNFLDHETAKIDRLIDKQEQLIALLQEKRQAVISHAVTKGLNPDATMKDSGVEWLGQVPEHWIVSKFGYISQVVRGGSPRPAGDPTLFNGDYSPWVTVAEITKDDELYLTSTETYLTKKGSEQCRIFHTGTLLLSNSGATLGVPKILSINANANDGVVGFESLAINIEYAYFYLSILTHDLRERVKQGSGQPNLNTDIVKAIAITIPPENEIREIVADIKNKIEHFSKVIESAEKAIQLMQERRTALISAAVTGKIDVRNWQAPPDAMVS